MSRIPLLFLLLPFFLIYYHNRFHRMDEPVWMLFPVVAATSLMSGVPFEFRAGKGYVSFHGGDPITDAASADAESGIVINRSCSGMNYLFIITTFGLLLLYYLKSTMFRMSDRSRNGGDSSRTYILSSLQVVVSAYLFTVLANATRIFVSIKFGHVHQYFPGLTVGQGAMHYGIGLAVYFSYFIFYVILTGWYYAHQYRKRQ